MQANITGAVRSCIVRSIVIGLDKVLPHLSADDDLS